MKEIHLTKNRVAFVDDDDYARVSQYRWYAYRGNGSNSWYTRGYVGGAMISMHRFIMNPGSNQDVDHIDLNGLNNTKDNLRVCSRSENMANRPGTNANSTGFKGVWLRKKGRPWEAGIKVGYKSIYLGAFDTPEEAAAAYDKAAIHYFGEFALTNAKIHESGVKL